MSGAPAGSLTDRARRALNRRSVYAFLAPLLLALDLVTWAIVPPQAITLVLTLAMAASACLLGWWPRAAGSAVIVVGLLDTAIDGGLLALSLATGIVLAEWTSRRWSAAVVAAIGAGLVAVVLSPADIALGLYAIALVDFVSVLVGLSMRRYEERLDEAARREELLRLRLEIERRDVHAGIALALHDSVATDLAQVLVGARLLARDPRGAESQERVSYVLRAAEDSMRHVRELMRLMQREAPARPGTAAPPPGAGPSTGARQGAAPPDVLVDAEEPLDGPGAEPLAVPGAYGAALAARGMSLEDGLSACAQEIAELVPAQRRLVSLVLREGIVNALKYAPEGSAVRLTGESEESSTSIEIASVLPRGGADCPAHAPDPLLSGGFGLRGLAARAESLGGSLSAGPVGGLWLLGLTLPRLARPEALA